MKITLTIDGKVFQAELNNSPTSEVIYSNLPITTRVNKWGNEIYFSIEPYAQLESDARTTLKIGDLAYYPPMKAFCIFFGPTPASQGNEPEAAGPVNVFGSLENFDVSNLSSVRDGSEVVVKTN